MELPIKRLVHCYVIIKITVNKWAFGRLFFSVQHYNQGCKCTKHYNELNKYIKSYHSTSGSLYFPYGITVRRRCHFFERPKKWTNRHYRYSSSATNYIIFFFSFLQIFTVFVFSFDYFIIIPSYL